MELIICVKDKKIPPKVGRYLNLLVRRVYLFVGMTEDHYCIGGRKVCLDLVPDMAEVVVAFAVLYDLFHKGAILCVS